MKTRVRSVMTAGPVVAVETTRFKEIVGMLAEYRISALPVVDDSGRLVGVVSEADLLHKEAFGLQGDHHLVESRRMRREHAKAGALLARDLMTSPAVTIGTEASIAEAARVMHDKGVKRLPVVDEDGRVVGIVTRSDLLRVFLRPDAMIREDVVEGLIVKTLWMDPTSIEVHVTGGVVKLSGKVDRKSDIRILTNLIGGVDGVVSVVSGLGFRYDDTHVHISEDLHPLMGPLWR
ncbi:MAG TPA: CBS domain-containing protein [Candidatus Acidoferrales bacterium]|nr:CBS domain-containing protein [Candidatus Acidoferrales bacterium]